MKRSYSSSQSEFLPLNPSLQSTATDLAPARRAFPRLNLKAIAQRLLRLISPSLEPQIQWQRDRQGHSYYRVYDPVTEKRYYFESASEVRSWLEQRYYEQPDR